MGAKCCSLSSHMMAAATVLRAAVFSVPLCHQDTPPSQQSRFVKASYHLCSGLLFVFDVIMSSCPVTWRESFSFSDVQSVFCLITVKMKAPAQTRINLFPPPTTHNKNNRINKQLMWPRLRDPRNLGAYQHKFWWIHGVCGGLSMVELSWVFFHGAHFDSKQCQEQEVT